jgi:ABC-type antimicrobial peptide transport system permease subunit
VAAAGAVARLPVVLDRTAATASSVAVGESVNVTISGLQYTGVVTDIVEAFPGTDPTVGVVVADFQSLQIDRATRAGFLLVPTEWWLSSTDRVTTTDALRRVPALAPDLVDSSTLSDSLRALGATTLGALLAGFAAALAFAAVGFTVNLVIGSRERLSEFVVLRAIGLSRRQIMGMLLIEQTFLVGLGLAIGLLIGVGVSALVVPLVVISPTAEATIPSVLLAVPWDVLGASAAGAALLLGLIVVVAANRLQRTGLGGSLRLGDEA